MIGWMLVGFAAGLFVAGGYLELWVVRERIRQAWRRGFELGSDAERYGSADLEREDETILGLAHHPLAEERRRAAERLILDTGGRLGSSDAL